MMIKTNKDTIPARSSPGKRTTLSAGNQGRGDKYPTGKQTTKKIRGRENITIGTWNVRTLNATGKVKEVQGTTGTSLVSVRSDGKISEKPQQRKDIKYITAGRRTNTNTELAS